MKVKFTKIILFMLVLFCTFSYSNAQTNQKYKKVTEKDRFDIAEPPDSKIFEKEEKIRNNYKLLNDSLKQIFLSGPEMNCNIPLGFTDENLRICCSDDRKIRISSLCCKDMDSTGCFCKYLVQYGVAPGKTRCLSSDTYSIQGREMFREIRKSHSFFIDKIYHLRKGIYIIKGIDNNSCRIFAVDIGRGILKDAYIFPSSENGPGTKNSIQLKIGPDSGNIEEVFRLTGEHLQIAEYDADGTFTGNYSTYIFNGSYFDEEETFWKDRVPAFEDDYCEILRVYFKDAENYKKIDSTWPCAFFSVCVEIAYDTLKQVQTDPFPLTLREDKPTSYNCDGENDEDADTAKYLFRLEIPLRAINGYVFVENVNLNQKAAIVRDTTGQDPELKQVTYVAGKEKALPYEWLRYTAASFNRRPEGKEYNQIRWAVEIDGNLHFLDPEVYQGNQIDLQMKEEWKDKAISVIPYIEGKEINRQIAAKTEVAED